jgi:hypothetical protein
VDYRGNKTSIETLTDTATINSQLPMTPFTITNSISKKDYAKLILKWSYQRPLSIFLLVVGCIMFCYAMFSLLGVNVIGTLEEPSMFQLIFGTLFLLLPVFVFLQARKNYDTQPRLHLPITYTFTESELISEGNGFSGRSNWSSFTKKQEIGKYILLYVSKSAAEILDISNFTEDQLKFIRSKVKNTSQ